MYSHPIKVAVGREISEQFVVEYVGPPCGQHIVAPAQVKVVLVTGDHRVRFIVRAVEPLAGFGFVLVAEIVPSAVEPDPTSAPVGELVRDLGIDIVEGVVQRTARPFDDAIEKERVHSSGTQRESGVPVLQRSFQMELLGKEAGGDASGYFLRVAVVGTHVHHAGDPAAVPRRERAFIDRDFLDGFGSENRQQSEKMTDIVKRCSVQQHQILVRAASTDVYSRKAFVAALHARHHLEGLQNILLAEDNRSVGDELVRDFNRPHIRGADSGILAGGYPRAPDLSGRSQSHIEREVLFQVDPLCPGGAPYVGICQFDLALRNGQGIESEVVGGGAGHSCR